MSDNQPKAQGEKKKKKRIKVSAESLGLTGGKVNPEQLAEAKRRWKAEQAKTNAEEAHSRASSSRGSSGSGMKPKVIVRRKVTESTSTARNKSRGRGERDDQRPSSDRCKTPSRSREGENGRCKTPGRSREGDRSKTPSRAREGENGRSKTPGRSREGDRSKTPSRAREGENGRSKTPSRARASGLQESIPAKARNHSSKPNDRTTAVDSIEGKQRRSLSQQGQANSTTSDFSKLDSTRTSAGGSSQGSALQQSFQQNQKQGSAMPRTVLLRSRSVDSATTSIGLPYNVLSRVCPGSSVTTSGNVSEISEMMQRQQICETGTRPGCGPSQAQTRERGYLGIPIAKETEEDRRRRGAQPAYEPWQEAPGSATSVNQATSRFACCNHTPMFEASLQGRRPRAMSAPRLLQEEAPVRNGLDDNEMMFRKLQAAGITPDQYKKMMELGMTMSAN